MASPIPGTSPHPHQAAIADFVRLHDPSTDAHELPAIRQRMKRRLAKATRALERKYAPHRSATRPAPRRRGAGRPRAQAARSSAKSGDSGDPDPGESDPAWLYAAEKEYQPLPAVPCRCGESFGTFMERPPRCFLCGHQVAVAA